MNFVIIFIIFTIVKILERSFFLKDQSKPSELLNRLEKKLCRYRQPYKNKSPSQFWGKMSFSYQNDQCGRAHLVNFSDF